jgi:hypothetical protein
MLVEYLMRYCAHMHIRIARKLIIPKITKTS